MSEMTPDDDTIEISLAIYSFIKDAIDQRNIYHMDNKY